ncbi:LapA family protein [Phormidesmis sp. 146-33]
MRQINFLLIFVICLALVLFGIENTEPTVIRVVEGVQVQAPLSIELILAMGIGAVMAWVFSVWSQIQRMMDNRKELDLREDRIQELEQDVERYKAEIQQQQRLLPQAQDAESREVFAQ